MHDPKDILWHPCEVIYKQVNVAVAHAVACA